MRADATARPRAKLTPERALSPPSQTFRNFFSGRILWDESMASASAAWCNANPTGTLVGLVGSDHVKFGCGVPARTARQLPGGLDAVRSVMLNPKPSDTVSDPSTGMLSDGTKALRRDPVNFGRGPDGRVNFDEYILQLRYAAVAGDGGAPIIGATPEDRERAAAVSQARPGSSVLPIADYLVFSKVAPSFTYRLVGADQTKRPSAS